MLDDKQPTTASEGETMKPQSESTVNDWSAVADAMAAVTRLLMECMPPLTPWQRFVLALDDAKETMLAGLRQDWRYFAMLWLGIVVGGLAGWLEWGM